LVTQAIMYPIINNAYLFYRVRWRPRLIFQWQALKELWNFGFKMFMSGIIDTIFNNIDSLIIGKLFPPAILGYYFRSRSLNNYVVQYSSGSLMSVLFPALSKVQHNAESFKEKAFKGYNLINFAAFFFTGLFFVIGEDLIILMFGAKWQPSVELFHLIIITAFVYPLSSILVNILTASGNSTAFLKLEILKKIFLGLSLSLGFLWGIKGYLICNAIAYFISVYLNIVFASLQLKVSQRLFVNISIPYLLIIFILGGVLYYLQSIFQLGHFIHLCLSGTIYTLAYLIIVYMLKLPGFMLLKTELNHISYVKKIIAFVGVK